MSEDGVHIEVTAFGDLLELAPGHGPWSAVELKIKQLRDRHHLGFLAFGCR